MNAPDTIPNRELAGVSAARSLLPFLLLLFAGSGCAALIYEIVWFQLLQLVIGSSAVSLGVLLGTFMGGMCLGSLLLPRVISAQRHPLRVYGLLELGIGCMGIAVLFGLPWLAGFYIAHVASGLPGILLRGLVCAVCLLPPTVLMGATLPAIARWVEMTPQGVSWLGFFYGGNIAGAVCGCLLAGFYLLRIHDTEVATYVAATVNATVALVALGLSLRTRHHASGDVATQEGAVRAHGTWAVYVTIGLSGFCALGAEVVWTRLLSLLLGGTVYTFSIILAVFLIGLGIGSGIGSLLSRGTVSPRIALGCCQVLLTAAIAWTAYMVTRSLPYWPIDPSLSSRPWLNFQLDLVRCIWAILPATCLWGASFPLALAAVTSQGSDPGRLVGGVYAANTVGAILGAIGVSLLLIPWLGTQQSQRVLIALSAVAGVFLLLFCLWVSRADAPGSREPGETLLKTVTIVLAAAGFAVFFSWSVPKVPWELVAYGRYLPSWIGQADILYMGEGMNSSVAVSELTSGVRNFHVSGKVEASSEPQDMRLQRMLGHIPALFHPQPRSVLVVGCGAGVTAGSFVLYPGIKRIVICEIEPLIPRVVTEYFGWENNHVLKDPRVEVVYDDARHYILTTREKFDIITSDPIHPWVKGSATLYTKEYFELVRQHLNPGGIVTQWVPLYESNSEAVQSELATFFDAFPRATIWSNDEKGKGYDLILLGQDRPSKIDIDELQQRMDSKGYLSVTLSLDEVGLKSAIDLLATYGGQGSDLAPWLRNAQVNRDRNLRLQYLAGMGSNLYQGERIYDEMLRFRKFPEQLFTGSDRNTRALREALHRPGSK
jgi:spermidine synthase